MNLIIIRLVAEGFKIANTNAVQAFSKTDIADIVKMDMASSYFVDMLLIISALKVGKKMSVYVGQLFQLNGMSDSIRDGLGGMAFAAGMMLRTGTSMLGRSGNASENTSGATTKSGAAETKSISEPIPNEADKEKAKPTTDIKQEKNQGMDKPKPSISGNENGNITDLSSIDGLEDIGSGSNVTDAVDLEKPAPATNTDDYSYEEANAAANSVLVNTGHTSAQTKTVTNKYSSDMQKADGVLDLFNGSSNKTATPENYSRKD